MMPSQSGCAERKLRLGGSDPQRRIAKGCLALAFSNLALKMGSRRTGRAPYSLGCEPGRLLFFSTPSKTSNEANGPTNYNAKPVREGKDCA